MSMHRRAEKTRRSEGGIVVFDESRPLLSNDELQPPAKFDVKIHVIDQPIEIRALRRSGITRDTGLTPHFVPEVNESRFFAAAPYLITTVGIEERGKVPPEYRIGRFLRAGISSQLVLVDKFGEQTWTGLSPCRGFTHCQAAFDCLGQQRMLTG